MKRHWAVTSPGQRVISQERLKQIILLSHPQHRGQLLNIGKTQNLHKNLFMEWALQAVLKSSALTPLGFFCFFVICLSACLLNCLSNLPSIYLSVCLPLCLSVCASAYMLVTFQTHSVLLQTSTEGLETGIRSMREYP